MTSWFWVWKADKGTQLPAAAVKAIEDLNYVVLNGRPLRVVPSQRDPSTRRSGVGNTFIKVGQLEPIPMAGAGSAAVWACNSSLLVNKPLKMWDALHQWEPAEADLEASPSVKTTSKSTLLSHGQAGSATEQEVILHGPGLQLHWRCSTL